MQIGELARHTGCDVETIRFYEREALLDKPARDPNGYRRYDDSHLTQLGFIRHCRSLDIALSDIRTLLALSADPRLACGEINDLIDRQIAGVHDRIESLLRLEGQLKALRSGCGRNVSTAECGIIEDLKHASTDAHCHCHVATRESTRVVVDAAVGPARSRTLEDRNPIARSARGSNSEGVRAVARSSR